MRTAFISDIHANLDALETVLADIARQETDRIVCLGDIVGYGPEPNPCVARVRDVCKVTVVGNHDYAALGRIDTLGFNEYARAAAEWTSAALDKDAIAFLSELPLETILDGMRLVHASPLDPERWTYILSYQEAKRQFAAFTEQICFIGHSHLPIVVESEGEEIRAIPFSADVPVRIHRGRRYLINVGSVGQPRDRDPRCGYAWYDDEASAVMMRRLEYPVASVQKKILDAGLPPFLAQRLTDGV
ncbi:MAG TPA: metallophosphoesterase family protein [Candidatus Eisenbacteria bacterium]|nr:metallophosphoesterase family protein [Candidatus Eisenbacteria bacterium]